MTKPRSISNLLDHWVEAIMSNPEAPIPPLDPRVERILAIAADLRGMPSQEFKGRLKADILSRTNRHGQPLFTVDQINERLAAMAVEPPMVPHDTEAALRDLPNESMRFLMFMDGHTIGVTRGSSPSHWERHPAGDEMLSILEGETEIVTLTDEGPVHSTAGAGSVFICPRGLWHRLVPRSPISILFATPGEGTEISAEENPLGKSKRGRSRASALVATDIRAAIAAAPELSISASTTEEEAMAAFPKIAQLDNRGVFVGRFSGESPWERHAEGDELLHALEGEVEVTVLTDQGAVYATLRAGSVFVCPKGLWHKQAPRPAVTLLSATPQPTDISFASDPRLTSAI